MIPTFTTERLRLRHWQMKDFEPYAALKTSAELQKYTPGGCITREKAWESFCAASGEWAVRGLGVFLVADIETDLAVGFAGFWYPVYIDEPELCWSLFPGNEGRGYATEAAAAVRDWAYEEKELPALMSFIHPENAASIAVAKRLGATLESETTLLGAPRLVYRHIGGNGT